MRRTATFVVVLLGALIGTLAYRLPPARAGVVVTNNVPYRTVNGSTLVMDIVQPAATGGP